MERLKHRVEALASFPRDSAGDGERRAAHLIADWMTEAGCRDVRIEPFRYQGTYAIAHALHIAAGMAFPRLAPLALASLELEASGRFQWIRSLLPGRTGHNVVARVGSGPRKIAIVAHHDAANTGLAWKSPPPTPGFEQPIAAALALMLVPKARPFARLVLGAALALQLDIARSPTVPGANDNATGVAAMLELAEDPPEGVELVLASVGCEESGMGGMLAFLDAYENERFDLVLGLDTLGSGRPFLISREGTVLPHGYGRPPEWAADAVADVPRRRIGGWTDPILARFAGIPALSLLSCDERGRFTNYHVMSDTADRVDWDSVRDCLEVARRIVTAARRY